MSAIADSESAQSKSNKGDILASTTALRALLDASDEALVVSDHEDQIIFANRSAHDLWGFEDAELEGIITKTLFAPQFQFLHFNSDENFVSDDDIRTAAEGFRKDGTSFSVEVKLKDLELEGASYHIITAKDKNASFAEEALRSQAAAFDSLHQFAAGLAHEFNNILTGVLGNLHLAMDENGRRGRMQPALLEGAHNASLRARELTKDLLEFAQSETPDTCPTNLGELVEDNCVIALGGARTASEFNFAEGLHAAVIDPALIGQVIHQIVGFGSTTAGHCGRLKFQAENRLIDSEEASFGGDLMFGSYVELMVEMEGAMVSEEEADHLFEPYARQGMGNTGLSLSICRSIVRAHGGVITAMLNTSGNLEISLLFPASTEAPAVSVTQISQSPEEERPARILVMDDEQLVRLVLQRTLEGMGHQVVTAVDGEEAIERYVEGMDRGDRFDLVFLDIFVKEGMGGRQTCYELGEIDPMACCVAVSGSVSDETMVDFRSYGFVATLAKPFDAEELGTLVTDLSREEIDINDVVFEETEPDLDEHPPVAVPFSENIVEIDFTNPPKS